MPRQRRALVLPAGERVVTVITAGPQNEYLLPVFGIQATPIPKTKLARHLTNLIRDQGNEVIAFGKKALDLLQDIYSAEQPDRRPSARRRRAHRFGSEGQRQRHIGYEAVRLEARLLGFHGMARADARSLSIEVVATAFDVELKTVEKALRDHGDEVRDPTLQRAYVETLAKHKLA